MPVGTILGHYLLTASPSSSSIELQDLVQVPRTHALRVVQGAAHDPAAASRLAWLTGSQTPDPGAAAAAAVALAMGGGVTAYALSQPALAMQPAAASATAIAAGGSPIHALRLAGAQIFGMASSVAGSLGGAFLALWPSSVGREHSWREGDTTFSYQSDSFDLQVNGPTGSWRLFLYPDGSIRNRTGDILARVAEDGSVTANTTTPPFPARDPLPPHPGFPAAGERKPQLTAFPAAVQLPTHIPGFESFHGMDLSIPAFEGELHKPWRAESIRSFADKKTQQVYDGKRVKHLPDNIQRRANKQLKRLDAACDLGEFCSYGDRIEKKKGKWKDKHTIRVSGTWRVMFNYHDGMADEVELLDYHP